VKDRKPGRQKITSWLICEEDLDLAENKKLEKNKLVPLFL
jgi:hypothetical protein